MPRRGRPQKLYEGSRVLKGRKRCRRCKDIKFNGSFRADSQWPDGLKRYCNQCRAEVRTKWRTTHAQKIKDTLKTQDRARRGKTATRLAELGITLPDTKYCPLCDRTLGQARFRTDPSITTDGLMGQCAECSERLGTPDNRFAGDIVVRFKECRDCGKSLPTRRFRWSKFSPDNLMSRCAGCSKLVSPEQKRKERGFLNRLNGKRTGANRLPRYVTRKEKIQNLLNRDSVRLGVDLIDVEDVLAKGPACYLCGVDIDLEAEDRAPEIEHMIPLSRGGSHTLDNVAVVHGFCNGEKTGKTPEEYFAWKQELADFLADPIY